MGLFLENFVSILSQVVILAIIVQALMSWVMPGGGNPLGRMLADITGPVLRPVRRVLPPVGGLDLSPILAIILIQVLSSLVQQAIHSST